MEKKVTSKKAPSKAPQSKSRGDGQGKPSGGNADLEDLLEYLGRTRGFDFTAYKRSTLTRRIDKRMQDVSIGNYGDYIDYLEVHPQEFAQLFNTILINVTAFFRDPPLWEFVRDEIVPKIVANKQNGEAIRVWSAGSASGEEAYTVAMLLAEALGLEEFKRRVKIYGTDMDEEALLQARQATYTAEQVEEIPPPMRDRYFDRVGGRFVFNKELRRSVIFGRHDLILDAPISKVGLITCRNTLMYFNAEAQARILTRFGFALNDSGYLFLGRAETLLTRLNIFEPVDLKRRIFMKATRTNPRDRLLFAAQGLNGVQVNHLPDDARLRQAALDADPLAQIIVDANGNLLHANEAARSLFRVDATDQGKPLQDLELSYRPVELRSLIEESTLSRHSVLVRDIQYPEADSGQRRFFDLTVIPLIDLTGNLLGTKIIFAEVTRYKVLQEEILQSRQELETAYEELQSANEELETTNEELQSANEELETTNEELQSTVEELETTNEELQSTNEELETMNEELQATNEELETSNEQLRQRGDELTAVNTFSSAVLDHMLEGLIVVDRDLRVTSWNRRAVELWGLRSEETVGKHLLNLDIGLPMDRLRPGIRRVLSGAANSAQEDVEAVDRRGRTVSLTITLSPLTESKTIEGVIIMMEDKRHEAQG